MSIKLDKIFESPDDGHYFFGYFNTPQVSKDGTKLLAVRTSFIDHVPSEQDIAEVGYFNLLDENKVFIKIGTTNTFNWQQGCMLQFCGPNYDETIIFNNYDGSQFICEKINLNTLRREVILSPIYTMFPDGGNALVLDFARHYWCRRGYSYGNIVEQALNREVVAGDGIWHLDLNSGEKNQIISIEAMLRLKPLSNMRDATHYLEHMTLNPLGTKFTFLHRWKYRGGIHSRLLVSDIKGENIKILNDSGRMSHYCWRNEHSLIGYGGLDTSLNKLRKHRVLVKSIFRFLLPVYHALIKDSSPIAQKLTGDSYFEIDTIDGGIKNIGSGLPSEDGHPTMIMGSNYFITDTYARANFDQDACLYAYDLEKDEEALLGTFSSIAEFDETALRCDLHPCTTPGGKVLSIDTMDRGRRGIYAFRIEMDEL